MFEWVNLLDSMAISAKVRDSAFWKSATLFHLIYSLAGLLLGFVCIIGGIVLFSVE
jgi:hypothetical protein